MYVNIPMIESEQVGIVVLTGGKKRIEKQYSFKLKLNLYLNINSIREPQ